MASEKGESSKSMDERLTEVRDSVLLEGEEIVAEEMGDQSQSIILTKSRVLIIKVGLTVTGELNGQKIGAYPLETISSVNFRKGPLGAVIQVCTSSEQTDAHTGTPDNVIIFTGAQRVKKCEAIATRITKALGKPVPKAEKANESEQPIVSDSVIEEQTVAIEETPRVGKERKSLAEEMFEEMTQTQPQDVPAPAVESVVVEEPVSELVSAIEPEPEIIDEEIEEEYSPVAEFIPNPNLPRPVARKSKTANRVLALFGILVAMVLAGIAVTAPMRMTEDMSSNDIDMTSLMNNTSALRKKCTEIANYRTEVMKILQASNGSVAALESSVRGGNCSASQVSTAFAVTEQSWKRLDDLEAPAGLAEAKDGIMSGLFIRKTTIGSIPSRAFDPSAVTSVLNRLTEANASIRHGMNAIDKMQISIQKQIADMKTEKAQK